MFGRLSLNAPLWPHHCHGFGALPIENHSPDLFVGDDGGQIVDGDLASGAGRGHIVDGFDTAGPSRVGLRYQKPIVG